MAITISEETRQRFQAAYIENDDIDEIVAKGRNSKVAELVSLEIFALEAIHMVRAGIVEIARDGTDIDVVNRVLVKAGALKDADISNTEIRGLAINAASVREVNEFLNAAQEAKKAKDARDPEDSISIEEQRLKSLKVQLHPQIAAPSGVAARQGDKSREEPALT